MTLEQFLEALEQTPREWQLLNRESIIRLGERPPFGLCPLEAVDSVGDMMAEYFASAVMFAADNRYGHDPELRAALLQRTGLAEPEAQR